VFQSTPAFGSGFEVDIMMRPSSREGVSATTPERHAPCIQIPRHGAGDFVSLYSNSLGGLDNNGQMWLWDMQF